MTEFEIGLIWLSYAINLVAVGAWAWGFYRRSIRRRTVRRFFGGAALTVFLPVRDLAARRVVAEEDFVAAVQLAEFVGGAGIHTDFRFVEPDGSVDLSLPALVVICGPKTSSVVADAMASDPSLHFGKEGAHWVIADQHDGSVYRSPMDHDVPEGDIAYFARSTRRPGTDRTFIAIAGVHAAGSAGVVHYLSDHRRLRRLHRATSGQRLFSACIESESKAAPVEVVDSTLVALHVRDAPVSQPRPQTVRLPSGDSG